MDELGNRLLAALEAASDATERAIQALDPAYGSLIDARATTWLARTTDGRAALVVSQILAADRAATRPIGGSSTAPTPRTGRPGSSSGG